MMMIKKSVILNLKELVNFKLEFFRNLFQPINHKPNVKSFKENIILLILLLLDYTPMVIFKEKFKNLRI